ncbi:homeobox-leucine zipper protein ATHB-4 isoform X1 [Eucalyptus grandis]|uniref:homeobox-leucine zipper protein ATHB-4 isoform X1 n=1 Tax=Eucalyptus grandis TaxID=71139 RepID=UPI00192ED560|nr:homeobox-leucine zipper protein ATHB-4 isoform X1 [Eucalyptus grandis]
MKIWKSHQTNSKTRPFFGGVGVNRDILVVDLDDDNHVSSPNSTVSSISGKRSERDPHGENEVEAERTSCSCESIEEDGSGGDGARKKLRLSREQSLVLEETFKEHNTLNRCRTKTKQTEVDCEYLKRCCNNLTQENKRLQKEVQELRALKLSPQLYMHMNPPTTLTMCPSCQRVSVPSASLSPPSSSSVSASVIGPIGPVHNPFSQSGPSINPWARLQMQQGLNNLHS